MEVLSFNKIGLMMMVMMFMVLGNMANGELHYVGGSKISWAPNVNMTEWASHEHFHLNDWLYFGYNKRIFNVLEVNKTGYENCRDTEFIKNITRGGGRDVFQLTEEKTYYFLSGGGFCWGGMKVAIDVTPYAAPAPQPVPPKGGSVSYSFHVSHTLVLLLIVLMWIMPFN